MTVFIQDICANTLNIIYEIDMYNSYKCLNRLKVKKPISAQTSLP